MAPGYRTTATNTRRGNRSGIPEHDDFEGLPVRQWRQQLVTVAPPPEREENKKHDRWAVELPHGMPRDAHLLPPHTQELLRLARSGKLYKKRPLPEEDDADAEGAPGDKQEKKDSAASEGYSFKVRKWVRLERSAEDPGINLLAPRHKNTIMRPSKQLGTQVTGPMVTKATVKRIDAAGNPYTQEVIVPDGQAVDGEIISTSVVPAPEAAGEAVLPIATPARRKPPIPQKKKGRGRGRGGRGRGRLTLATPTRPVPQQDGSTEAKPEKVGPDGVKIESEDASRAAGDIEMNESSALDDDDGDEGSGDDDEGDGDESGTPAAEGEDQEMKDAPPYPPPDSAADSHAAPGTTSAEAPHPDVNLAPPQLVTDPVHLEGSPLKHVTLRSPTDPSPHLSPIATASAAAAAADATASADTGLSGVPGESTLGLQPSVPEPQQPVLLSQAFFRERIVDKNPAEPPGPVPAPVEAAPVEDSRMDEITSANPKPQGTGAEPIPVRSAVLFTGAELLPVVEPPPALESLPSAEPLHVLERPPVVEAPPVVEPPPTHAEELPQAPHKEDLPLPSSEEPMPGQMVEYSEQQVPPAAEPALPSPIMAPAPAPVPSPPLVPQVPVGEAMGDVGSGDVKVESGGADSAPAEGDSTTHVVINDAGAADVGAEKFGSQDAGDKDVLGVDGTRAVEVSTKDAETEDVVTEDVATEDGSFDILGSLSTSLNQQAEDDAPPAPIPAGPAETAASKPAQPAQPEETVPAATTEETGPAGQTSEAARTDHAEEAGEASKNNEPTQAEQTINTKEGQAPTQERPEKNEEQV